MKLSFLLLISFLLFGYVVSAQSSGGALHYDWVNDNINQTNFFKGSASDGYIYLSVTGEKDITVKHYDNQLHKDAEHAFAPSGIDREFAIHKLLYLKGRTYLFYSSYNKTSQEERLFVQEIESRTAKPAGVSQSIASSKTKVVVTGEDLNNRSQKWRIFESEDQSKILVQYRLVPRLNEKANYDSVGFIMLDGALNRLWAQEVRMPYTSSRMYNQNYYVTNEGKVYVLAKVYSSEEARKTQTFHFEILKYTQDADQVVKMPFTLAGKLANSAQIDETADHELFVAGFYSNASRRNEGFYFFKLSDLADSSGNKTIWMHAFDKSAASNDGPLNLELRRVEALPDGGIQMVGEENSTGTDQVPNAFGGSYARTDIYCNSLLVIQINKNGELDWMTPVQKKQKGRGIAGSLSFSSFHHNGNSYFFFMDNPENIGNNSGSLKYYKNETPGVLECVKIDASGNAAAPQVISSPYKDNGYSIIRDFAALSNGQMIVNSTDGDKGVSAALLRIE